MAAYINAVVLCALSAIISIYAAPAGKLCLVGEFEQQVDSLLQHIRLTEGELQNMTQIMVEVETALQARWPGCKLIPYGSTVSGLGLKSSDIDVYVEVRNQTRKPKGGIVIEAKHVLKHHLNLFIDIEARPTAKVPIVTFVHAPTETHCDVNFSSRSGIRNSQLIGYFLQLDKRALHLAIIVKYWATIHRIVGSGRMSSYAMSLMVIFYLQQRNILPSVASLQSAADTEMLNKWNTAFNPIVYTSTNNETLYELLGGFLKYYSNFDFKQYVISPYAGRLLNRQLFDNLHTVPEDFSLYKMNVENQVKSPLGGGVVLVQDVFDHDTNVCRTMYPSLAMSMLSNFKFAARMYDEVSSEWFLPTILTYGRHTDSVARKQLFRGNGGVKLRECIRLFQMVI